MRRIFGIAVVIALLVMPLVAVAAEIEGTVKAIDTASRLLTLENGLVVAVPDGIALDQLREGSGVRVAYEEKDGKNEATSVEMK
jgi:hypothetical protein